ncbi:MAG: thiamine pyrophosphate-dependent dehydrogenase E1 component subunit alpha [Oscillospiraceae bacterium]
MDKKFLLEAYEKMSRIRHFEMFIHENVKNKDSKFVGIMHSQAGEEAYASAVISQLRADDYLSTTYRNHAHSIARNISLKALAAEVYGRTTGVCKGRAGNMHAVDQNLNIIAGFGIIGAGLPATAGTALASNYKGTDQISVGFFGDGAVAQGAFHESMNLAKVLSLPMLFVNNNNHYAMSTPAKHNLATDSTTNYAKAYDIPAISSCGMDFFKAYEAAKEGIEYVRKNRTPFFIEFDCYRYHGQWEGDPQDYKDKKEEAYYFDNDPIKLFRQGAIERGLLTLEEIDAVDDSVNKQIEEAFEFAANSPIADFSDITTDIYADVY